MVETALGGARDMLSAPRDPDYNSGDVGAISGQGHAALVRALIKFERWDELLTPGVVAWGNQDDFGKFEQAFAETLALTHLGKQTEAKERLRDLKVLQGKITATSKDPESYESQFTTFYANIADGLLSLSEGKLLEGQRALLNAAEAETKQRSSGTFATDPPFQPWPVMRLLGDDYRKRGNQKLAIECYERALSQERNDGFSLAGLALAHRATGNLERATHFAGRLEYVWSQATPNIKWLADVRKLGLSATPIGETPAKERTYQPKSLDAMGPMNWRPFSAPALRVLNVNGKQVQLTDYQGKNVLLVFFLGEACVHCVGQLKSINDRMVDFEAQDTVVLAVCSATPTKLKESATLGKVNVKFLSDTNHENARRFSSYDDFEEIELHSTILIDKKGLVRWKRTGGAPFMNMDFLLNELKRINGLK